jgi:hypothetical protein
MATPSQIDDVLWRRARELAGSPTGLTIDGLGTFHHDRFEPGPSAAPTGHDAPRLVVVVADELGIDDADVRSHLRAEVRQALASAVGRPAPLGALGLIEVVDGVIRFHRSWRDDAAPPGGVEAPLEAWRAPADGLGDRVGHLIEALGAIGGALSVPDLRRLLDELDYDLDDADWRRHGARIVSALPF